MNLFLCSNFKFLAKRYLSNFFDLDKMHNCLLVGYADDEGDFYSESNTIFLESLNFNVFHLDENYKFFDKIDMIFVKGGNTVQLLHLLRKYNQFDKIKDLVNNGVLYVGQSAGAIIAGIDTEWTLKSEPYNADLKSIFGKDAYRGFCFVDSNILVHASKLRFPFSCEIENAGKENFRVSNKLFYGAYLKEKKMLASQKLIILKDNGALLMNNNKTKIVNFDWSNYPVEDKNRLV